MKASMAIGLVLMAGAAWGDMWCEQQGDRIICEMYGREYVTVEPFYGVLPGNPTKKFELVPKSEFDDLQMQIDAILKHLHIKLEKKARECKPERYEVVPEPLQKEQFYVPVPLLGEPEPTGYSLYQFWAPGIIPRKEQ